MYGGSESHNTLLHFGAIVCSKRWRKPTRNSRPKKPDVKVNVRVVKIGINIMYALMRDKTMCYRISVGLSGSSELRRQIKDRQAVAVVSGLEANDMP